jgi:hypothetical protein
MPRTLGPTIVAPRRLSISRQNARLTHCGRARSSASCQAHGPSGWDEKSGPARSLARAPSALARGGLLDGYDEARRAARSIEQEPNLASTHLDSNGCCADGRRWRRCCFVHGGTRRHVRQRRRHFWWSCRNRRAGGRFAPTESSLSIAAATKVFDGPPPYQGRRVIKGVAYVAVATSSAPSIGQVHGRPSGSAGRGSSNHYATLT